MLTLFIEKIIFSSAIGLVSVGILLFPLTVEVADYLLTYLDALYRVVFWNQRLVHIDYSIMLAKLQKQKWNNARKNKKN